MGLFGRIVKWTRRNPDRAGLVVSIAVGLLFIVSFAAWALTRINVAATEAALQEEAIAAVTDRARGQEFYVAAARITEQSARGVAGWSWQNLDELKSLAANRPQNDAAAIHRLRSEATKALAAFDAKKIHELLHGFDIYTLEFSPDGHTLVAGANRHDDSIKIAVINTNTWEVQQYINIDPSPDWIKTKLDGVRSLAFHPDGKELYVGSRSGWIHVIETGTWQNVRKWQAHEDYIHRVRFSSDGLSLLTCSEDRSLKRWWPDGRMIAVVQNDSPLTDFIIVNDSLSPHSAKLIVASVQPLCLRESDLQREELPEGDHEDWRSPFNKVASYPDGGAWIRESYSEFEVFDSRNLRLQRKILDRQDKYNYRNEIHGFDISQNGRWLLSSDSDSTKLWDLAAGTSVLELSSGGRGRVVGRFHPNQDKLAICSNNRLICYELSQETIWQQRLQQSQTLTSVALSSSGDKLAATRMLQKPINRRDQLLLGETETRSIDPRFTSVGSDLKWVESVAPGGLFALYSREARFLQLVDNDLTKPTRVLADMVVSDVSTCSPDGRSLYLAATSENSAPGTSGRRPGEIRVLNLETLQDRSVWVNIESEQVMRESAILMLAAGPNYLAFSSNDRSIRLLDRDRETVLAKRELLTTCDTLSMASDESYVIAGSREGDLFLMDLPSLEIRQTIHAHNDSVRAVTFVGLDLVVSASRDRELKLWSLLDGRLVEILAFGSLSGPVTEMVASEDGRVVAVLVEDETAVRLLRIDLLRERLRELGLDW